RRRRFAFGRGPRGFFVQFDRLAAHALDGRDVERRCVLARRLVERRGTVRGPDLVVARGRLGVSRNALAFGRRLLRGRLFPGLLPLPPPTAAPATAPPPA